MAYMVAGYLIIWLVSFVLIFSMVARQRKLQQEIETLKEMASDNQLSHDRVDVASGVSMGIPAGSKR